MSSISHSLRVYLVYLFFLGVLFVSSLDLRLNVDADEIVSYYWLVDTVPDIVKIPPGRAGKGSKSFPAKDVILGGTSNKQGSLRPLVNVTVPSTKGIIVHNSSTVTVSPLRVNSTIFDKQSVITSMPISVHEVEPKASAKPIAVGTKPRVVQSTVPTISPLPKKQANASSVSTSIPKAGLASKPIPTQQTLDTVTHRSSTKSGSSKDTSSQFYVPRIPFSPPTPVRSLRFGNNYPWDHIDNNGASRRTFKISRTEQFVISKAAAKFPYRADFYSNYLQTHTETKGLGQGAPSYSIPPQVLSRQREGIMTGVKVSAHGECDGCKRTTPLVIMNNGNLIRKFVGNTEVFDLITKENIVYPDPKLPFNVTVVTVTSHNRLFILPQVLSRWPGFYVFVITTTAKERPSLLRQLGSLYLPSRVTTIVYTLTTDIFPINELRNLGIRNIRTTHFMMLDMDLILSRNTYSEVMKLPKSITSSNSSTVILPLFFFARKMLLKYCVSFNNCVMMGLDMLPQNKSDLITCLDSQLCLMRKKGLRTHLYVLPDWFNMNPKSSVSQLECFVVDFQEPYVILPYTKDTPLFDERFYNYGYNKVQLIEHLRAANFKFYILNHAFAMDLPHPDSTYRRKYLYDHGIQIMHNYYRQFQKEMNMKYDFYSRFPICRRQYIHTLYPLSCVCANKQYSTVMN